VGAFAYRAAPITSVLYAPTPLGIGISVLIVILGALNLTLDFAFIVDSAAGAPRYMQWYGAFGLMLSLI
jgi:uncharacterized YccA/Bax inhibitor family protein